MNERLAVNNKRVAVNKKTRIFVAVLNTALLIASAAAVAQESGADEETALSEAELQQILAPIALYPDTVLAHILIAATYPLEVVQAHRWVQDNPALEGEDALRAVEDEDWDPSVKALVPFPQILDNMNRDLEWTQDLGEAFLSDEEAVMSSIQNLRQRAYDEGSLESLEHLNVTREQETIIIEPAVREVIYIPYYDSRYVYGDWYWHDYPPVHWHYVGFPTFHSHAHHRFYWGPRIHISFGFFFSSFQWHHHRLVVLDHHHHHHVHFGYQVARHSSAIHWRHDPHHRRGVVYRNPRTRDYFRKYADGDRRYERSATTRATIAGRRQLSDRQRTTISTRLRDKSSRASTDNRESRNDAGRATSSNARNSSEVSTLRERLKSNGGQTVRRSDRSGDESSSVSRENRATVGKTMLGNTRTDQNRASRSSESNRGTFSDSEQSSQPVLRSEDSSSRSENSSGSRADRYSRARGAEQSQVRSSGRNSGRQSFERSSSRGSGQKSNRSSSKSSVGKESGGRRLRQ